MLGTRCEGVKLAGWTTGAELMQVMSLDSALGLLLHVFCWEIKDCKY